MHYLPPPQTPPALPSPTPQNVQNLFNVQLQTAAENAETKSRPLDVLHVHHAHLHTGNIAEL